MRRALADARGAGRDESCFNAANEAAFRWMWVEDDGTAAVRDDRGDSRDVKERR